MLPYGRQSIDKSDIQAVMDVLESDYLTTGPAVQRFERAVADFVDTNEAIALSSGTAALHAAMYAAGIDAGDEVIVPAITFAATANAVVYQGGTPVFADVDENTLLVSCDDVRRKITSNTKAVVAVDYAGQPCDYDALHEICQAFDLVLIADACHSMGGRYQQKAVGACADLSCFSLHPVKPITAGEGGVVTTDHRHYADRIRSFRNHGITKDHRARADANQHVYDMQELGFNYRLTDIQAALAWSQLNRLDRFCERRRELASLYDQLLANVDSLAPLHSETNRDHAYHLYVIRCAVDRDELFRQLRKSYIGANVHYRPVYEHSFYRQMLGDIDHRCPNADAVYPQILSLPLFPAMQDHQVEHVVETLDRFVSSHRKAA